MEISKKRIVLNIVFTVIGGLFILIGYVDMKSSSVVPILMYHSFQAEEDKTTPCVSPKIFEDQVKFLINNRYNIVGPDKVISYMTRREKMPPKTVAITIDDGLSSFYENAYPTIKKYKIPVTLFMPTDRIGQKGYMNWRELRDVSDSGLVTVGSHTKTHPWLPTVSVDEEKLHEELVVSKKILEEGLGKKVDYLCYPNGAFNDLVKEEAKNAGYKGAFTTNVRKSSSINDIYAIRRLKMSSSSDNPLLLWGKINRAYAWYKERR